MLPHKPPNPPHGSNRTSTKTLVSLGIPPERVNIHLLWSDKTVHKLQTLQVFSRTHAHCVNIQFSIAMVSFYDVRDKGLY